VIGTMSAESRRGKIQKTWRVVLTLADFRRILFHGRASEPSDAHTDNHDAP
jgi:hypothetical protein